MPEELRLPPEIERYYEKWRKDPTSKVFAQLADAYRKIGMLDEAIDVCLQGLKVQPSYVSARMVLARAYLEKGLEAEGEHELLEVLKGDPNNILACRMLADLLYRKGRKQEAVGQYQRLLRLTPLDREIKAILEKAESELKVSPGPMPLPTVAEEGKGRKEIPSEAPVLIAGEKEEEFSLAAAEPPTREREEDAFLTETIANLYLKQGLYDRAVDVFSKMLSADPGNLHIQERLQEAILQQKGEKGEPALLGVGEEGREEAAVEEDLLQETSSVELEPLPATEMAKGEPMEVATSGSPGFVLAEEEKPPPPQGGRPSSETLSRWLDAIRERRKSLEEQWTSRSD